MKTYTVNSPLRVGDTAYIIKLDEKKTLSAENARFVEALAGSMSTGTR